MGGINQRRVESQSLIFAPITDNIGSYPGGRARAKAIKTAIDSVIADNKTRSD